MSEILNFWNLVMCVFSLNFVILSGFLEIFKPVIPERKFAPKLEVI
jgi:hypothetical protein